jgi:hypothetical protein
MTITPTRPPELGEVATPAELLIREARAASRRRRQRVVAVVIAVLVVSLTGFLAVAHHGPAKRVNTPVNTEPRSFAGAKTSPYPATLKMRRGLYDGGGGNPSLPWGTVLSASQSRWVTIKSSGPNDEWGVWRENGDPGQFPVRSIDGGVHWRAAGPQLATDWAGGGIYFVGKVIPEGPSSVVMVSNAVIDVTTDGGRHWYQYLNAASDWIISAQAVNEGIGLRIRPFPDGNLPKRSYAIYVLSSTHHEWIRTRMSVG